MQGENYSSESSSSENSGITLFLSVEQSIVSIVGILLNLTIMFTMPFAKMNRRIKLILTALAFADLGAVLMNSFISLALTSIVQVFTNQLFIVSSMNLSACVSTQFLADFFEASVQWMTACLTAERFYVVYFPFRAAQLRLRTTLLVIVGTFGTCFVATSPHFALYTITAPSGLCAPQDTQYGSSITYFIIRHLVYEHVIAPAIILICNTLVLLRLARRENSKHGPAGDRKAKDSSKLKITVTLVVVSTLHICGFIPCGILCLIRYYYSSTSYAGMAFQNSFISYAVYGIMHFVNFIIYVASMDAYRHVLTHPPICTYKVNK